MNACLRCEYPLVGLPENHACPECGLQYDNQTRIYKPAASLTFAQGGMGIFSCVWGSVQILKLLRWVSPQLRFPLLLAVLVGLVLLSWSLWKYYCLPTSRKMVAILPQLLMVRRTSQTREIPWSNISRVTSSPAVMGVNVYVKDKKAVETIAGFFRSKAETHEFVHRATRRIERPIAGAGTEAELQRTLDTPGQNEIAIRYPLRSVRETVPRWHVLPLIFAGLIAIMTLPVGGRMRLTVLAGGVFLTAGIAAFLHFRAPKRTQEMRIDPQGVSLWRGTDAILQLPWNEIESAHLSRWGGQFTIYGEGKQILFACLSHQLLPFGYNKVKDLATHIMHYKAVYSPDEGRSDLDTKSGN